MSSLPRLSATTGDVVEYLDRAAAGGLAIRSRSLAGFSVADAFIPPGITIPRHGHELPVIAFVYAGGSTLLRGSKEEVVTAPSVRVMTSGEEHSVTYGNRGEYVLSVELDVAARLELAPCEVTDANGPLTQLAWHALEEFRHADRHADTALECLLVALCARGRREVMKFGPGPPAHLRRAVELIHDDSGRALSLDELAREAGVSRTHLVRLFHRHHGCSPSQYQQRVRLARARAELELTDRACGDIAIAAGFSDHSHFTRVFRRHFGLTPTEARRAARRPR